MPKVTKKPVQLRVPQLRVLRALADGRGRTRADLAVAAGFTAISGTVTRVLNGIREGSSSGAAHPGLLALGLIERTDLDVEGLVETLYAITDAGLAALNAAAEPPPLKDKDKATNDRYKIG